MHENRWLVCDDPAGGTAVRAGSESDGASLDARLAPEGGVRPGMTEAARNDDGLGPPADRDVDALPAGGRRG